MNIWTQRSIELANQHEYLDQLFKVYPLSANEKRELDKKTLGLEVFKDERSFMNYDGDAIYNCSDTQGEKFAKAYLGYNRDKGLDFIAKVNETFIIGETKFLVSF